MNPFRRRWLIGAATGALLVVGVATRGAALLGFVGLFGAFALLERVFALRSQRVFRPGWATDAVHFFVNHLFIVAGTVVILGVVARLVERLAGSPLDRWWAAVGAQPAMLQFAEALIVVAVSRYWSHRLSHRVPWLWRFHAVHHSSAQLDWLAAVRLHPVDSVLATVGTGLPLFLLGFDRATFGLWLAFAAFGPFVDHANLRLRLPVLRWVIPNPEWHHWHHATTSPDGVGNDIAVPRDRNFSPFPWVDVVFGTAYLPRGRWPSAYGIPDPVPPSGYLAQLAHPFRRRAAGVSAG